MALFDRRLLAYFDDGLGASGSTTFLDRICDYQRDLAEIERELAKYQVLLGDRQVQLRHPIRDRDGWITKNREQKTIKERYRGVVQAMYEGDTSNLDRTDALVHGSEEPLPIDRRRRGSSAMQGPATRAARRASHASSRASVSSAAAASAGLGGPLKVVWLQIDTVQDPPMPRAASYVVRAQWQNRPWSQSVEETDAARVTRHDNGDEVIVFRKTLTLKDYSTTNMVSIGLFAKQDGRETLLGDVSVDSLEGHTRDTQMLSLKDKNGRQLTSIRHDPHGHPMQTRIRLKVLIPPEEPTAERGARASDRFSTYPQPHGEPAAAFDSERFPQRPSLAAKDRQEHRGSLTSSRTGASAAKPTEDGYGHHPPHREPLHHQHHEDAGHRKSTASSTGHGAKPETATASAVTQDPAAAGSRASERRPSSSGISDGAGASGSSSSKTAAAAVGAAAATGAAAVGAAVVAEKVEKEFEVPSISVISPSLEASPSRATAETPAETPMTPVTPATVTDGDHDDDDDEYEEGEEEDSEGSDEEYDEDEEGEEEEGGDEEDD